MKELVGDIAKSGVVIGAGVREGRAEGEHGRRAMDGCVGGVQKRVFVVDRSVLVVVVILDAAAVVVEVGLADVLVGDGRVSSSRTSGHVSWTMKTMRGNIDMDNSSRDGGCMTRLLIGFLYSRSTSTIDMTPLSLSCSPSPPSSAMSSPPDAI